MADTFLTDQIATIKTQITEVNAAISTAITAGHAQYKIDTGQTAQSVQRLSLKELRELKSDLYSQLQDLLALSGDGFAVVTVYPGY